jgi:predicted nucleic acid-binding protein
MSGADTFFDTNVLLYLLSGDAAKADRVETLLADGGSTGVQVLNEFAAVARRKLGMRIGEIKRSAQFASCASSILSTSRPTISDCMLPNDTDFRSTTA